MKPGYKGITAGFLEADSKGPEGRRTRPLSSLSFLLEEPKRTSGKTVAGTGNGEDTAEEVDLHTLEILSTFASHLLFLYIRNKKLDLIVPLTDNKGRQARYHSTHISSIALVFRAWEEGSLMLFISAEDPLDEVGQAFRRGVRLEKELS